jgi:chemotaxis protein MotB
MAKKKGGGGGGHGGGWFVTFADLMALLMSFFVMVAAYSTQDQKKLQVVAGSMRDAFGVNKESRYAGIIEKDGIPTKPFLRNAENAPPDEASDFTAPSPKKKTVDGSKMIAFDRGFGLAAASLRQALQDMPEITELSRQVIIEETKEGLNISLTDLDGRSMFPEGSVEPYERTRKLLEAITPSIRKMPNRLSITGHTAAPRPGTKPLEVPWTISTGRSVTIRELLATNGIPDDRFSIVAGKADTEPMFPDNPYLPANRRITITLLREAPPVPFGQKP